MTTHTDLKCLSDAFIEHGKYLDTLTDRSNDVRVTRMGNGGVMLSRAAAEILVEIFRGDGDVVITDRDWLRYQLRRLGVKAGDIDLLADNIAPPKPLAAILPFRPARG